MDPNDGQKIGDNPERKSILKSLAKRWLRSGETKRAIEIAVNQNQNSTIFQLPDELLIKIIDSVPIAQWASMEFVSRRFQNIVHGLWENTREIRLAEFVCNKEKEPYKVMEGILKKFLIRAPNMASISGFADLFDECVPICLETIRLFSKFRHLQTIDFSGGQVIKAKNFAVFLNSSASRQSWKRLDIFGGIYGEMKCNNEIVSKNQPTLNLECFKFKMETLYIFDRFLQIEWSGLTKLIIVDSFKFGLEVLSIIGQCTGVTHLEIEVPECGIDNQPSFANFMQVVADLENLSVLKIIYGPSDNGYRDSILKLIRDLALRGITDFSLVPVYCTDQILDAIIDHLPHLKSLELDVTKCTTATIRRLANGMGKLESLKFRSECTSHKVDGTIIRAIGDNMANLQCLQFNCPTNVGFEDFRSLADLRNLKELRIKGRTKESGIVETWVRLGFGSCLESLELELDGISAAVMVGFFKIMPRLRSIKTSGVTDEILKDIESCPMLVKLDLGYSPSITSNGIQSVIDRCPQLKILNVIGHYGWFPSALTVGKYRKIMVKS